MHGIPSILLLTRVQLLQLPHDHLVVRLVRLEVTLLDFKLGDPLLVSGGFQHGLEMKRLVERQLASLLCIVSDEDSPLASRRGTKLCRSFLLGQYVRLGGRTCAYRAGYHRKRRAPRWEGPYPAQSGRSKRGFHHVSQKIPVLI